MDSKRRSFYKGYANLKNERDKAVSKPSTSSSCTVGQKRKKLPKDKDHSQNSPERLSKIQKVFKASTGDRTTEQTVTKLRRANTLDYEALSMAHSSNIMRSKLRASSPSPSDNILDKPALCSPAVVHAATPPPPDDTLDKPALTSPAVVHAATPPLPDNALDKPASPSPAVVHAATPPPPNDALEKPASPSPAVVHAATPPPPDDTLDKPASPSPAGVHAAMLPPPDDALNHESREQEIELCLQQIRAESNLVINNFTIEIEEIENKDNNIIQENSNDIRKSLRKNRENKQLTRYKHIDFLSEDETIEWSSSSWDETLEDYSEESHDSSQNTKQSKKKVQKKQKKKASKRKAEKATEEEMDMSVKEGISKTKKKRINKAKERSLLMNTGRDYITKSGKTVEAKAVQENPCRPDNCHNKCYEIPDSRRKSIFDHYWALNKERRRDWIVSNTKKEYVKRRRSKDVTSRRQFTHTYSINEGEGKRVVCLKFLLKTLDVKQKTIHNIVHNSQFGFSKDDERGKNVPPNKTSPSLLQSVKAYIDNLPAVPSHYCRKNSKKFYLPQEFRNLSNLYKIYKETQQSAKAEFVGEKVFKNIFLGEYNIAFHVPRKDKCIKCIKYENDTSNELQYEKKIHLKDKEETYKRFEVHQDIKKQDDSILCTTFDLQKVLNTPYGESMLLYYSRKLAVYNLTFYESVTREGFCYTWSEDQGKRGSNEVCTILAKYIEKVDNRGNIKHLLLYCDSCPGQNKNKTVLACISRCLKKCSNIISIQINYLLPGHTYMPVDSMHSVIEKSVTNTIVWAPSQWLTVFELARKTPGPYNVEVLNYKDFEAWVNFGGYFRGNMVGKISKVRVATFKKSTPDIMQVKYSMSTEAEIEEIDIVAKTETIPKKLYKTPLPISKKKYADLVKLCTNNTIPERFHHEYTKLQSASNIQDMLEDSDIEDIEGA